MEQLSFSIEREQEIKDYTFENYDWLIGNTDNLKIFFKEELKKQDLSPELRADALKRLEAL